MQSSGAKGDLHTEQAAKRQKVGIAGDPAKASTSSSSEPAAFVATQCTVMTDKNKSMENRALQESVSSKQQSHASAVVGHPIMINKYKLDNRPTAFRVIPPLPAGFADVSIFLAFPLRNIFAPSFMMIDFTIITLLFHFENDKNKKKRISLRETFLVCLVL